MNPTNTLIGLILSDTELRDQVCNFLRTGGFKVVSLDSPKYSQDLMNQFSMLIVSADMGLKHQSTLLHLKHMGRPYPILVICGHSADQVMSWVEAGFDDALPFPMGQSVVCNMVRAYLPAGVAAG